MVRSAAAATLASGMPRPIRIGLSSDAPPMRHKSPRLGSDNESHIQCAEFVTVT